MSDNSLLNMLSERQIIAKQKQQERSRLAYQKNKEKIKARIKQHYQDHREECIARVNNYNKENREKVREYAHNYYLKKRQKAPKEQNPNLDPKDQNPNPEPKPKKTGPTHCDVCNIDISASNRYAHFISNKHLKNQKREQDKIDELMTEGDFSTKD